MPDEIPPPVPSAPTTKPPLTAQMIQSAKDTGTPKPGAGGWTPSPATVVAIGATGTTFGALAAILPTMIPGKLGLALGGLFGALSGGLIYFATKSAGPRAVSP